MTNKTNNLSNDVVVALKDINAYFERILKSEEEKLTVEDLFEEKKT